MDEAADWRIFFFFLSKIAHLQIKNRKRSKFTKITHFQISVRNFRNLCQFSSDIPANLLPPGLE
jgi:hypothetical protein